MGIKLSQSEEEWFLETVKSPADWAEAFLKNPVDPQQPLVLRSYQREVLENTRDYKNMVVRYGRRMGKCQKFDDIITLSNGERITIEDLWNRYNNNEQLRLMNLNEDISINGSKPILMEDNGFKETFEVKTRSGRKIEITENHPLLRIDGWQPVADLKPGDRILVPSKLDYNTSKIIDGRLIKLLAYLLGDGMITSRIEFTNQNKNIINEFEQSAHYFDIKTRNWFERGCYYSRVIRQGNANNEAIDYLRDVGLFGTNSHTKFIPSIIYELHKDQQALFLSRLFACDGWASVSKSNRKSGNCEIGYCSVSEELIYGVSELLVRFGIKHFITEKNVKYNGSINNAYQLCIRTKEDIELFVKQIGIFSKEDACNNVLLNLENRSEIKNGYFYQIPKEAIDIYNITTPRKYGIRKKYNTSKDKLLRAAVDQDISDLVNICNSDTYFDEIVSITSTGSNQTYAIEVPDTHNYITNNIITHNTVVFCADLLWWAAAQPLAKMLEENGTKQVPCKILILTPMDSQIKMIFDTILELCQDSPFINGMITKIKRSDVNEIHLTNGSVIKGMTIGISSANKGTSARGQSADYIFLDEADFIPRDVMEESILPISSTNTECKMRVCSTPSGKRDLYYEWCWPKGTSITTETGIKDISDIQVGDKVFGIDGSLENVTTLFKQPFNGDLIEFITGASGKLSCTPNHELYVHGKNFVRAEDISTNDYILVPREHYDKTRLTIDIPRFYNKFDNIRINNYYKYLEIGNKTKAAHEIYGSKHMRSILKKYDDLKDTYGDELWPLDSRRRQNIIKAQEFLDKIYDESINMTALYKLLGYYLAEGNILKDFSGNKHYYSGIQLTFNSKETEYIADVKQLLCELFPSTTVSNTVDRCDNSISIFASSSWLSYVFITLCDEYSHNKRIHNSLLSYNKYTKHILSNYIKGDGYSLNNGKYAFVTTSKELARQLYSISINNNIPSTFHTVRKKDKHDVYTIYQLCDNSRKIKYDMINRMYIKVDKISLQRHNDHVYNFETSKTHTYNVQGICSHNCTRSEDLGWWHRHYPSWHPDNPSWISIQQCKDSGRPLHESTEYQFRSVTEENAYNREYGAEFGEEQQGVYKNLLLNKSIVQYCAEYDASDTSVFDPGFPQVNGNKYIIGVDWNSYVNGGQIVVLELCVEDTHIQYYDHESNEQIDIDCTGKFRLFYRKGVKVKEGTQRATREEIIRIMKTYRIDHLYVDYGYGDTNIEELTHYGKEHLELGIRQKLHVIDSGSNIEHYDVVLQKNVKKRAKSLMINTGVVTLEEGRLVLPKEEDVKQRLINQMRSYVVKGVTVKGDYTYDGEDHILDAFNLAMWGFHHQYSTLLNTRYENKIRFMQNPLLNSAPVRKQSAESPILNTQTTYQDPEKVSKYNLPQYGGGNKLGRSRKSNTFGSGFRRTF